MNERRKLSEPTTAGELLERVPLRVVLDRMSIAVVGIDAAGILRYANPAHAAMLGYAEVASVMERSLCSLLVGNCASHAPAQCSSRLRDAGKAILQWRHADGFPIYTSVSPPLLVRATDPIQMFAANDVTELIWVGGDAPLART